MILILPLIYLCPLLHHAEYFLCPGNGIAEMVSQIILAFFPTLSHLHVHGEGKNVFIIINVAVFALYWPKVLAASAGRVERVRGGIPIQGPSLATTDNEWSGFWVLIRGIVDNEHWRLWWENYGTAEIGGRLVLVVAVWLWPTHCDEWTLWPGLKKQIMQPLCPSICTHKTMLCYKSQMWLG